jgi:hypothetical protein
MYSLVIADRAAEQPVVARLGRQAVDEGVLRSRGRRAAAAAA